MVVGYIFIWGRVVIESFWVVIDFLFDIKVFEVSIGIFICVKCFMCFFKYVYVVLCIYVFIECVNKLRVEYEIYVFVFIKYVFIYVNGIIFIWE